MNQKTIGNDRTELPGEAPGDYTLASGSMLGQYRVIGALGRGGMGEVYEVEHRVLRRRYALKLLSADIASRPGALERFEREAQVMATLEHPNIVRVDDFGETDGRRWLRMELMGRLKIDATEVGGGLSDADVGVGTLQELAGVCGGRIPEHLMLPVIRQVLTGLAYAHQRGVVHRDLKPGNILLTAADSRAAEAGVPLCCKVSDFGLVRMVGEEWLRSRAELSVRLSLSVGETPTGVLPEREGSSTRSLLGTYEYMSPEQKRGEDADARSDVYAIGLMAYRLLTGKQLGFRPPSYFVPGMPAWWDDVVLKAMEEDPAERFADAGEMLAALSDPEQPAEARAAPPPPQVQPVTASACPPPSSWTESAEPRVPAGFRAAPHAVVEPHTGTGWAKEIVHEATGMVMVYIPAGSFTMGSPTSEAGRINDERQHRVTLTRGFYLGKYEVTQAQWVRVMGDNPSHFKNAGADAPVENVSWDDCQAFSQRLGGGGFRLPTEAEWEYAARGGPVSRGFIYSGSNSADEVAWYSGNSFLLFGVFGGRTRGVGQKRANELGLYDMSGNVYEWCQGCYGEYPSHAVTDPNGPQTGSCRVIRGGGWIGVAADCRAAYRFLNVPSRRYYFLGFRAAFDPSL